MDFCVETTAPLENLQLPSPELLNFYELRNHRIFYLDYEIDVGALEIQKEIIRINFEDSNIPIEERIPIKIFIDSYGGYSNETLSIISTIQMSKTPVYTINIGIAYSGAGLILMAGHKRYAMPYSKAMIHTGSNDLTGTYEQVMSQSQNYEKVVKILGDFICAHTLITPKVYKKRKGDEWYLDKDEQIEYGLVDEEVTELFDILNCEERKDEI